MCYSAILYESGRTQAVVDVRCRQHSSVVDVKYQFGTGEFQDSNEHKVDSSL